MKGLATFGPLVLLIVIMYFLLIRPQKKREKETNSMRNNLHVGDEVITIGGLKGKIVKTKDDSIVIQVGADKLKFEMMKWSISKVVDSAEKPQQKAQEPAEEEEAVERKPLPRRMKKADHAAEAETAADDAPAEKTEEAAGTEETDSADEEETKE